MAWVDGTAYCEFFYQGYGFFGLVLIASGEIGYGLYAWDVGVAREESVTDLPGYAAVVVAGSEERFCFQAVPYLNFVAVVDNHDTRRIGNNKRRFMIGREILPSIQKHLSSYCVCVYLNIWIKTIKLIKTINMVKMSMGKKYFFSIVKSVPIISDVHKHIVYVVTHR